MIPVICEFTDIYVDSLRIYLIPQPSQRREAIEDLFTCCLNIKTSKFFLPRPEDCGGSVSFHTCRCFHNLKYVPSVASLQVVNSAQRNLTGVSWLMHHWSFIHHPDHFAMKILELHGLLFNMRHGALPWNSSFPQQEINQLVSMDYPGTHRTDYEKMVLALLETVMQKKTPLYFIHSEEGTSIDEFMKRLNPYLSSPQIVAPLCAAVADWGDRVGQEDSPHNKLKHSSSSSRLLTNIPTLPTQSPLALICRAYQRKQRQQQHGWWPFPSVSYLEHAFLSPVYKNNIPAPHASSAKGLRISLRSLIHNKEAVLQDSFHCLPHLSPLPLYPKVAILLRAEGKGLRRFVNLQEIVLSIRKVTGQEFIPLLFISSKTSGLMQAIRFCQFHLLITPHTSQLTNLVFAPPNISVIEIQNQGYVEHTFLNLGRKMDLHYQLLKSGHPLCSSLSSPDYTSPEMRGKGDPKASDVRVPMRRFEEALNISLAHLRKSLWIAAS
jgi:hypothetical protein